MSSLRLVFTGTGTSGGVPEIGCECEVCTSKDPRDRRNRTSAMIETDSLRLVIDTGPDVRLQLLREKVKRVDGVLYTHAHADHIMGLDDLRALSFRNGRMPIPLHAHPEHLAILRRSFWYLFEAPLQVGGGILPIEPREIVWGREFVVGGLRISGHKVVHGVLPVTAWLFDRRIGYVTDASEIPPETEAAFRGLDVLVLNALRPKPHPTHFHFEKAIETARRLGAKRTLFVHMTHDVGHEAFARLLPAGMEPAWDGLRVEVPFGPA